MKTPESRPRGRPRKFDRDEALVHALNTFWGKGYANASLDDLTETMGINRPSLYSSFGNKHDLFLETIDLYNATIGRKPLEAFEAHENIRDAVDAYLTASVQCVTSKDHPNGCLIMNVAVEQSVEDPIVRDKISGGYEERIGALSKKFEIARANGELPDSVEPETHARMLHAFMQCLASRARVGTSRKELTKLAAGFRDVLVSG